jgi:hypothetical protein
MDRKGRISAKILDTGLLSSLELGDPNANDFF